MTLHQLADGVQDSELPFLNAGRGVSRNRHGDVGDGRNRIDIPSDQGDGGQRLPPALRQAFEHVGRSTARGDPERDIARSAECLDLPYEHVFVSIVVGNARNDAGVARQGDGRQRPAFGLKASDELGGEML